MTAFTAAERAHRFDREHARNLRALAYRMLGSRSDAEDVVQDAWLRWAEVDERTIASPAAFLRTLVTRLCLDRLGSAAHRREQYVGVWLPEPLVNEAEHWCPGPEVHTERAQDVSTAFMLALERLGPLERAAFLLHDVFDVGFADIARQLDRSPAACRQLASRARRRVREAHPSPNPNPNPNPSPHPQAEHARAPAPPDLGAQQRVAHAFAQALADGQVDALAQVLAADARLLSDGGGVVQAVPQPVIGARRVAQALAGFRRGLDLSQLRFETSTINGAPGWVVRHADGRVLQTVALEMQAPAQAGAPGHHPPLPPCIRAVYIVRNPDKLTHL